LFASRVKSQILHVPDITVFQPINDSETSKYLIKVKINIFTIYCHNRVICNSTTWEAEAGGL
jgi:hypothetical protein